MTDMESLNIREKIPSHITVTTWQDYPYSGYTTDNGKIKGTGYAFELFSSLQKYYKFNYTIKLPQGGEMKSELEEIVSLLTRKEVDMAVAFLPIESNLRNNCTFSTPLDEMKVTFLMKRPPESATGSGLLAPFDLTVWILILVSLILVGPVMYFLILLRSKYLKKEDFEQYSIFSCMWFVYGALLKQGSTLTPVSNPTRLLFATWWIFVVILSAFYTANLTAFLTLSEFTLPIKSVKDLVRKHFKWFVFEDRAIDYMIHQNNTRVRELRKSWYEGYGERYNPNLNIESDGVLRQVDSGKVFITETIYATMKIYADYKEKMSRNISESKRCTYVIVPGSIFNIRRAFAFSNEGVIYYHFNKRLRKMIEGGLVKYLKSKDLPEAVICPLNLESKERKLSLRDLYLTYKIVAFGIALATIIFLGELIYCRMQKRKSDKIRKKLAEVVKKNMNTLRKSDVSVQKIMVSSKDSYGKQRPKKSEINGHEYYVITDENGSRRLIPTRMPSALLFQYSS